MSDRYDEEAERWAVEWANVLRAHTDDVRLLPSTVARVADLLRRVAAEERKRCIAACEGVKDADFEDHRAHVVRDVRRAFVDAIRAAEDTLGGPAATDAVLAEERKRGREEMQAASRALVNHALSGAPYPGYSYRDGIDRALRAIPTDDTTFLDAVDRTRERLAEAGTPVDMRRALASIGDDDTGGEHG